MLPDVPRTPQEDPRVPLAGGAVHPGDPQVPNVLPFERTPFAGEGVGPGAIDPEQWQDFEDTPEAGFSAGVGIPDPPQGERLSQVPPAGLPIQPTNVQKPVNPREDTRVKVPDSTWMRAREMDVSAIALGTPVHLLNIKEGPGWVDLRSPNTSQVIWDVRGTEDLVGTLLSVVTGPSGFVSVWVGEMGTQIVYRLGVNVARYGVGADAAWEIDQRTGVPINNGGGAAAVTPLVQARFHPASGRPTSGGGSIQSRSLNAMPHPRVALAGLATYNVGYPPLNREVFHVHASSNIRVQLMEGSPAVPVVVWTSAAALSVSVDCPPDAWIRVVNATGSAAVVKPHWRDLASIPS